MIRSHCADRGQVWILGKEMLKDFDFVFRDNLIEFISVGVIPYYCNVSKGLLTNSLNCRMNSKLKCEEECSL